MALRVCSEPGCPEFVTAGRCTDCQRTRDQARGSSTARGYGSKHDELSRVERAKAIGSLCHLCGETMTADQPLALDHTEDRTSYRGVVHLTCNASDGAKRGNAYRSA